jgi:hypothetical protein
MGLILVDKPISWSELKAAARPYFEEVVKAVVDVEKGILAIGGELHSDEEALLLSQGSKQENLWGINLFTEIDIPDMIEFDSMINIRPSQGNRTRSVTNESVQRRIFEIVKEMIK